MFRAVFLSLVALFIAMPPALALDPINATGPNHLAIRGTDTTAYFRKGGPEAGTKTHSVRWKGATWHFATAREAALFKANPEAYAPQFGAYCTGGLAGQHVVEGKPQHWRMHGRKLYLFHTSAGARRFSKDPQGMIRKAQAYWDTLGIKE